MIADRSLPSGSLTRVIAALAGGVGAARLLRGMATVVPPSEIYAIVNTGDDTVLHGLHICPDIDTVTYTLAGAVNLETGWGLQGDTWHAMAALDRFGGETWFRLGDNDLATHLYRTQRLSLGASLATVTAELASAWKIPTRVLPMSDDPVRTRLTLASGDDVAFQHYFVKLRHSVPVRSVRFEGADVARPSPGVVDSIESAHTVVLCPSNPIVSIGPILALPGIEKALTARREDAVAISPIVAGAALKGPADRLLAELGHEVSVVGVARLYAPLVSTLVIDEADSSLAAAVEAEGVRCVVTETVMSTPARASHLAASVLRAMGWS